MAEKNLTKEYIIEAFFKILETTPFEKVSVSDITNKAGVSRMSFYRNFESKEDLVKKTLNLIVTNLQEMIKGVEVKNEYTIIKCFFESFRDYKTFFMALADSEISKSITDLIMKKLKENYPEDKFNKTKKYLPVFKYAAITSVIFEWLKDGCNESPEEMSRFLCSLTSFDIFENFEDI